MYSSLVFRGSFISLLLYFSVLSVTTSIDAQGHVAQRGDEFNMGAKRLKSCGFNDIKAQAVPLDPSSRHYQHPLASPPLSVPAPELEVIPLILSGRSDNRVDLIFFSDGYLYSERSKFIDDATRLATDVSQNQTLYAVKPLLNFWAAFTPSKESGIGVGGVPKEYVQWSLSYASEHALMIIYGMITPPCSTVYGLYRDGSELRGVYYSKPEVARAACSSLGIQCDYPILLANDPFYGGLGGEFTVITSSYLNGPLVLRHELGHSIIEVGEEYDGGYAYCGVNAAHESERSAVPWSHWLTDPTNASSSSLAADHVPRVERAIMPLQSYPWTMLNTSIPWSVPFASSGTYDRYLVKFSLSGVPNKSMLKVELDSADLGWQPEPLVGMDRWHYDIHHSRSLGPGAHELKFTLTDPSMEGSAQLCSLEVLEFGNESEFNSTPGHYSLYPTFSLANETNYRPTNDDCLMRAVTKPNFCKACMENLWLELLKRVRLIDGITEWCESENEALKPHKVLDLALVPLTDLRQGLDGLSGEGEEVVESELASERYTIFWSKDGQELEQYTNQTTIDLTDGSVAGNYTARVRFSTDAIRLVDHSALAASVDYQVLSECQ